MPRGDSSGLWSWVKDKDHIEMAFDFAGMGARNGVGAGTGSPILDPRPSLLHFSDGELPEMIGGPVFNRVNVVAHNLERDRCLLS
jgi:hypothetical protein